eukprot:TRINITY_DN17043_c0_g1_i3.p5 TRINITY_DN17043_c0_g1~~TRINITY_DN17043_c0_g1_i3.p5  ORF type:complete len:113 (+),score=1.85 TRINITY_DN17043_c0_g1_i3:227-565(+)
MFEMNHIKLNVYQFLYQQTYLRIVVQFHETMLDDLQLLFFIFSFLYYLLLTGQLKVASRFLFLVGDEVFFLNFSITTENQAVLFLSVIGWWDEMGVIQKKNMYRQGELLSIL